MNWKFTKKIEEMSDEEIKQRIVEAFNYPMPEIKLIPYVGGEETITYEYEELTALCPMTGIQDLYKVVIIFVPKNKIPELKSLRFYFLAYKDLPISHEHLAYKIYKDFKQAVEPEKLKVILYVAIRGGIKTTIKIGKV